jgi:integrase
MKKSVDSRVPDKDNSTRHKKVLEEWEIASMLKVAEATRYPIRNRGIILLAADAGLSPLEMSCLKRHHLFRPSGGLGAQINLQGKEGVYLSPRTIPMPRKGRLWKAMHSMIENIPAMPHDPLIISERATPGGKATKTPGARDLRQMEASSISYVMYKIMAKAGIAHASALSLRTTFIVKLGEHARETKKSLRNVQELAGLRSLEGVQRLLEASDRDKQQIMRDLFASR